MSISITFKDLLDSVGFSGPSETGGESFAKAKSYLSNNVIRDRIAQTISSEWAKNEVAPLFVNVNNTDLVRSMRDRFKQFLEQESSPLIGDFADNPSIRDSRVSKVTPTPHKNANSSIEFTRAETEGTDTAGNRSQVKAEDPLLTLLVGLKDDMITPSKGSGAGSTVSPAGAAFSQNAANFIITITDQDIANLDETGLAALDSIGANVRDTITVPESAVFLADENIRDQFQWQKYPTFTGIDLQVVFMTPNVISKSITLKALTYSMHSGLVPVGTLGRDRTKGYGHTDRTIAGSLIAVVTLNDPLMDLQPVLYASNNSYAQSTSDIWRTYLLPDQFPLFDILCIFNNEYGFNAAMPIFGVKITDVGSVIAMSDSEIEVTYTYTALDIDIMRNLSFTTDEQGNIRRFDILANNEYLAKRERAINGQSEHKGTQDVASLYGALDRRADEIAFQRLQNRGATLGDVIKIKDILDRTG